MEKSSSPYENENECDKDYYFNHLSFQEYCDAGHLVLNLNSTVDSIRSNKHNFGFLLARILDVLIDTSVLPSNVMSLRDDKFIDFVKADAGDSAAAPVEIQDGFKNKYGYMQDDGTFVIQPGIKGNIEYLIDLLKKKCIEDAKVAKSSKHNQSSSSTIAKSTSSVQ
ncbi:unnamed protein product [Didymodactylos carnosus]|uniref:Uncharacterized protein n=1 Tax=Didymodactylos carnosus TaxID=1234261 RepID=A0A814G5W6_9BILA|nr:unnamed protein product [Didymodactylos carnosus]CAF0993306.1 unnamed protein product [Didymodactylos carnosus]CAF3691220.1 unnamed protein product [Didymodactylos carnosus]CAF3765109.1 unnamed protein product [Didymodactylos carnosus]